MHSRSNCAFVLFCLLALSKVSWSAPDEPRVGPVGFKSDVIPALTRLGCNTGGCHGKAEGQNGFRLSLFGFEPDEDYLSLTQDAFARRVNPLSAPQSLLLLKATGSVPHGGGRVLHPDSLYYKILSDWISQGAPQAARAESVVTRIELTPNSATLKRGGRQQLSVIAHFSDGSKRDVTRLAQFKSDPPDHLGVDDNGLASAGQQPLSGSVMARYQDQVAVARVMVPLGASVTRLPAAKNFIDELVFKQLKVMGLPPSDICDDPTFLRRATLDIAGRMPTKEEAESFATDKAEDRHERLVDRLLASDDYAYFFANKWSAVLRNRRGAPNDDRKGTLAFHDWIRKSLHDNRPYDQIIREVLTASGVEGETPQIVWYRELREPHALAEDAAQLFLGQRVQCARCHHHPSERWSQHDYWGLAAFFSRTKVEISVAPKDKKANPPKVKPGLGIVSLKTTPATVIHPRTGAAIVPAGLGETPPSIGDDDDPREALTAWVTDAKNPYFARALVNRYWKHFLGRGLVEPEDDMRATNPPVNPELLDALADRFIASKFDLKQLVRTICTSTVYRLSCEPNEHNARDRQHFARFYIRRLPAEVLLDAVDQVTLTKTNFNGVPGGTRAVQLPDNQVESYFLRAFGRPDSASACECERGTGHSLAQALHLFNSDDLLGKIGGRPEPTPDNPKPGKKGNPPPPKVSPGARLGKLVADSRPHPVRLRELYLVALSREPSAQELTNFVAHIERTDNVQAAYADILWALMNSSEFLFNH